MLLECAVGDSYGKNFEFVEQNIIEEYNDLSGFHGVKHPGLEPNMYSDDTQMSIAISELMLSGRDWTRYNIAEKFVECFHRDPRRGYAGSFYLFLLDHKTANDFLHDIIPVSDKSGAAMRAAPIGLYSDIKEVKEKTEIQANITHCTDAGRESALAVSLMSWFFYNHVDKRIRLPYFLNINITESSWDWSQKWQGKVSVKVLHCVQAAITAILESNSLSGLLKRCISFGGDVDTVAAIALSCASKSLEFKKDLPEILVNGLENGVYGKDYIVNLDSQLDSMF